MVVDLVGCRGQAAVLAVVQAPADRAVEEAEGPWALLERASAGSTGQVPMWVMLSGWVAVRRVKGLRVGVAVMPAVQAALWDGSPMEWALVRGAGHG